MGAAEGALRTRGLRAGRGATFGLGHVHDVVNTAPEHAVSVHAYSPPLTAMTYYAAASLQDLGLRNATDLDGGFRAGKAAGLPVG